MSGSRSIRNVRSVQPVRVEKQKPEEATHDAGTSVPSLSSGVRDYLDMDPRRRGFYTRISKGSQTRSGDRDLAWSILGRGDHIEESARRLLGLSPLEQEIFFEQTQGGPLPEARGMAGYLDFVARESADTTSLEAFLKENVRSSVDDVDKETLSQATQWLQHHRDLEGASSTYSFATQALGVQRTILMQLEASGNPKAVRRLSPWIDPWSVKTLPPDPYRGALESALKESVLGSVASLGERAVAVYPRDDRGVRLRVEIDPDRGELRLYQDPQKGSKGYHPSSSFEMVQLTQSAGEIREQFLGLMIRLGLTHMINPNVVERKFSSPVGELSRFMKTHLAVLKERVRKESTGKTTTEKHGLALLHARDALWFARCMSDYVEKLGVDLTSLGDLRRAWKDEGLDGFPSVRHEEYRDGLIHRLEELVLEVENSERRLRTRLRTVNDAAKHFRNHWEKVVDYWGEPKLSDFDEETRKIVEEWIGEVESHGLTPVLHAHFVRELHFFQQQAVFAALSERPSMVAIATALKAPLGWQLSRFNDFGWARADERARRYASASPVEREIFDQDEWSSKYRQELTSFLTFDKSHKLRAQEWISSFVPLGASAADLRVAVEAFAPLSFSLQNVILHELDGRGVSTEIVQELRAWILPARAGVPHDSLRDALRAAIEEVGIESPLVLGRRTLYLLSPLDQPDARLRFVFDADGDKVVVFRDPANAKGEYVPGKVEFEATLGSRSLVDVVRSAFRKFGLLGRELFLSARARELQARTRVSSVERNWKKKVGLWRILHRFEVDGRPGVTETLLERLRAEGLCLDEGLDLRQDHTPTGALAKAIYQEIVKGAGTRWGKGPEFHRQEIEALLPYLMINVLAPYCKDGAMSPARIAQKFGNATARALLSFFHAGSPDGGKPQQVHHGRRYRFLSPRAKEIVAKGQPPLRWERFSALRRIFDRFKDEIPINKDFRFGALWHMFESTDALVDLIGETVDPTKGFMDGKDYSNHTDALMHALAKGWSLRSDVARGDPGTMSENHSELLAKLLEGPRAGRKGRDVIIGADGAGPIVALSELPREAQETVVGFEQTEAGILKLLALGEKLRIPVIDMARHWLKKLYENALIGASVVEHTRTTFDEIHPDLGRKMGRRIKSITIIGAGSVGRGIMESLRRTTGAFWDTTIYVWDRDPTRLEDLPRYVHRVSREEALARGDLVIAATPEAPFELHELKDGAITINAGSGQMWLDDSSSASGSDAPAPFAGLLPSDTDTTHRDRPSGDPNEKIGPDGLRRTVFQGLDIYSGDVIARDANFHRVAEIQGKQVLVPRGGKVINMSNGIPAEFVQLTLGLLLACFFQAIRDGDVLEPGIHRLDDHLARIVFEEVHADLERQGLSLTSPEFYGLPPGPKTPRKNE